MKRPFDSGEGEAENFRWGNVKQKDKRTRPGTFCLLAPPALAPKCAIATQDGKPPTGYKCKICESSEVNLVSSGVCHDDVASYMLLHSILSMIVQIGQNLTKDTYARYATRFVL